MKNETVRKERNINSSLKKKCQLFTFRGDNAVVSTTDVVFVFNNDNHVVMSMCVTNMNTVNTESGLKSHRELKKKIF